MQYFIQRITVAFARMINENQAFTWAARLWVIGDANKLWSNLHQLLYGTLSTLQKRFCLNNAEQF